MANFAIIGVAGFVAPRHIRAIKDCDGSLIAALDPHDSVGVLDSFFPETHYFSEFERYDRHIDKLRRKGPKEKVHYVSVCSPNYLHDSHIRHSLRSDCDAICEKPLLLNPKNLNGLIELEKETNKKVHAILQLRLHPIIEEIKKNITQTKNKRKVTLTYITSRGNWYHRSWKGIEEKSGGVVTNIGIHFFDMLIWLFGRVVLNQVHCLDQNRASGYLELENAEVEWFLSVDENDLPEEARINKQRTFRNIEVDDQEIEFSKGFTDLHSDSYRAVLAGHSFGVEDSRASIELVHDIRNSTCDDSGFKRHPFLQSMYGLE